MLSDTTTTHHQQPKNPTILEPLLHALDPISLILNQNFFSSDQQQQQQQPFPLRLTSADSFIMERGPRYNAYAQLREKRLKMKYYNMMGQEQEEQKQEPLGLIEPKLAIATTPPRKKQVKFQTCLVGCDGGRRKQGSSSLVNVAQSVPDFSAALRKENRKPLNNLPSMMEMTPPPSKGNNGGVLLSSRGSKSAESGGEKKKKKGVGGVVMARKSYASIDELRSLSFANGDDRGGGRNNRVMGKRQF